MPLMTSLSVKSCNNAGMHACAVMLPEKQFSRQSGVSSDHCTRQHGPLVRHSHSRCACMPMRCVDMCLLQATYAPSTIGFAEAVNHGK